MRNDASPYSKETVANLLPKLEWAALRSTVKDLGLADLPEAPAPESDAFMRQLHDLICNVQIVTGSLLCPNCGRAYPVNNGIPNMLLNEDEV